MTAVEKSAVVVQTDLGGHLELIARGKVRDLYSLPDKKTLLFVATDRISAYDVIMKNVSSQEGSPIQATDRN